MMFMVHISLVFLFVLTAIISNCTGQSESQGELLYREYCQTCHNMNLEGGMAQSLLDGVWQFGSKQSYIFRNIKFGITQRGMPGFEEALSDDQINQIIDFITEKEGALAETTARPDSMVQTLDYKLAVETLADGLETPWAIDFIDRHQALVTEKPGRLRIIKDGRLLPDGIEGLPTVLNQGQGGLMDVTVDPDYPHNGWIYLAYSHPWSNEDRPPAMTRVLRGRIQEGQWIDQQILYEAAPEHYQTTRHHYGCRIVFDKQGFLYFSVGERGFMDLAQDLSRPNGKIHRIYPDGRIPDDNPFANQVGALPTIYTYGNRNPQGMAVHPETDQVWITEHGPMGGDELNLLAPGKNYGWPIVTYGINYDGSMISNLTKKAGMELPVFYWRPSTAVCGLDFYRGEMFPRWQGDLIVGALKYEQVSILDIEENRVLHEEIILKNFGRVRDVACGPDGAIYVVLNKPGKILRLTPAE
jgi:glucose/arabinose dehydrogenase